MNRQQVQQQNHTPEGVLHVCRKQMADKTNNNDNIFLRKLLERMVEEFDIPNNDLPSTRKEAFLEILDQLSDSGRGYSDFINSQSFYQFFQKIVGGLLFKQRERRMIIIGINILSILLISCDQFEEHTFLKGYQTHKHIRQDFIQCLVGPFFQISDFSTFERGRRLKLFERTVVLEKRISLYDLGEISTWVLDGINFSNLTMTIDLMKVLIKNSEENTTMLSFWKLITIGIDEDSKITKDGVIEYGNDLLSQVNDVSFYSQICDEIIGVLQKSELKERAQVLLFGFLDAVKIRMKSVSQSSSKDFLAKALSFY